MALTLEELQRAQAVVDGCAFGPLPALNASNRSTQDLLGNTQQPTVSPVPYYPSHATPCLHLVTVDMSSAIANNFVLLDKAFCSSKGKTNEWATLTGDLTEAQVVPFDGPIVGT